MVLLGVFISGLLGVFISGVLGVFMFISGFVRCVYKWFC